MNQFVVIILVFWHNACCNLGRFLSSLESSVSMTIVASRTSNQFTNSLGNTLIGVKISCPGKTRVTINIWTTLVFV